MKKGMGLICITVFLLAGCGNRIQESEVPGTDVTVAQSKESVTEETQIQGGAIQGKEEIPDNLITFDEKKIHIPQLEQDYEIWLFSDSHITLENGTEEEQTALYAAERKQVFTNDTGFSSDIIFSQFIDRANEKKPDLILFGGDIIDFPSEANVTFLKNELQRLEVPYIMTYGNHDWTFPWEYMTEQGVAAYHSLFEECITGNLSSDGSAQLQKKILTSYGNEYAKVLELTDMVVVAIDNSSNQVAPDALTVLEQAYDLNKPVILLQHVPFSTEALIARAAQDWGSPVTLGMQVHGGIAPNDVSKRVWDMTHEEESLIKAVFAGHAHFAYEEALSDTTVEIITDAAYKGKATKIFLKKNKEHQYFCDKFTLTVDDKQFDLKEIDPELSSVSELYPIAGEQLYVMGRVDENVNSLMVYDFGEEAFIFAEHGATMCWVQDKFDTVRYLKDNMVYDLEGNVIFAPDESNLISMIEYVVEDFKVTVTDTNHENPQEIWIE